MVLFDLAFIYLFYFMVFGCLENRGMKEKINILDLIFDFVVLNFWFQEAKDLDKAKPKKLTSFCVLKLLVSKFYLLDFLTLSSV